MQLVILKKKTNAQRILTPTCSLILMMIVLLNFAQKKQLKHWNESSKTRKQKTVYIKSKIFINVIVKHDMKEPGILRKFSNKILSNGLETPTDHFE